LQFMLPATLKAISEYMQNWMKNWVAFQAPRASP